MARTPLAITLIYALLTTACYAKTFYVSPLGDDTQTGNKKNKPLATINYALALAQPGDYVKLLPGVYYQDVETHRAGTQALPIKIIGSKEISDTDSMNKVSPAIIKGAGKTRIFQIKHSHIQLLNITIDGLVGNPDFPESFRDKLLFVHNNEMIHGIENVKLKRLTLQNAGGECLRFRHFVRNSEISYSSISNCGVHDFKFPSSEKNGEGIYIGTSFKQWHDGKNPTTEPDLSNNNRIHHNMINTQGNECIDIKEGASGNKVYNNYCTGNLDANSAGISSAGNGNHFYNNIVFGNVGSGFRFGSSLEGYGINNRANNNQIISNSGYGFKIMEHPQDEICENDIRYNKKGMHRANNIALYSPDTPCY